jgi:hypothetical protein
MIKRGRAIGKEVCTLKCGELGGETLEGSFRERYCEKRLVNIDGKQSVQKGAGE